MIPKPYPYQVEGITQIEQFGGRVLLADEMGLGKTLQTLWWWSQRPNSDPALVICPASVKYQWEREAKRIGRKPIVLEGQSVGAIPKSDLVIINYDVLQYWEERLEKIHFKAIFLDESQFLKNPQAIRTKVVRRLAKGIPYLIAISGTPLVNRPVELYATLKLLCPATFASRYKYLTQFCKPRWTPWGWKYDGASNLKELNALLRETCMVRRLKANVLQDLPEKTRRILPLTIEDPSEYEKASGDFLQWLKKTSEAKYLRAKQAESLTRLTYLKKLAAKLKVKAAVDWLNQWLEEYPTEKIVVVGIHHKMLSVLVRQLKAKSVLIDGTIRGRKRLARVDRFQTDPSIRVLVGQMRAIGVGLNLTAASTLAFTELDWVPANHLQTEDRLHRIGQDNPVWIWYLVAGGTIEEDLCEVLEEKWGVVSATLDGGDNPEKLNVYEELMRKLHHRLEV